MEEFDDITAMIADRATLFRHGLVGLLKERRPGWSCAEATGADDVVAYLQAGPVDIILLDLQLVGLPMAHDLRQLRQLFPHPKIVVMADSDDRTTILNCLAAGANGYVLKSSTTGQLLRALDTILCDGVFAPAALTGVQSVPSAVIAPELPGSPLLSHLTERQIEVFRLLSEGCATKTIARRLGLAVGTVKVHLAAIYRVLGAHSRVEALAKARGGGTLPALMPRPQLVSSEAYN
jgi:DNA-binding NarL/FixJ family response regulator